MPAAYQLDLSHLRAMCTLPATHEETNMQQSKQWANSGHSATEVWKAQGSIVTWNTVQGPHVQIGRYLLKFENQLAIPPSCVHVTVSAIKTYRKMYKKIGRHVKDQSVALQ